MAEQWYSLPVEETLDKLASSKSGLSGEEAKRRLAQHGYNEIVKTRKVSPLVLFLRQFTNVLVIILIIATIIAGLLGEWIDAIVILVIVILNAIFGFVQEYKAEKAIEALKVLAAPHCRTIRDGELVTMDTRELVPGDVVNLTTGDKVPADMRLLDTTGFRVNEAPLTGESVSVLKTTEPLRRDLFLGDRKNMCYLGCTVEAGRGTGVVTATGMSTELGKIAGLVQAEPKTKTPMQKQLALLGKQIGLVVLALVVLIFVIEYVRLNTDVVELFLTSVSLAVAAIPEGLPAVVTISLALGLQRMAKRNALIRRLPAVETLGSASVICTDKTGTLTRGEMNIVSIYSSGGKMYRVEGVGFIPDGRITFNGNTVDVKTVPELYQLLKVGMLCNDATLSSDAKVWTVVGDTTEGALIVAGMRAGLVKEELERNNPRVSEIAFTSERKLMSTVHLSTDDSTRERLASLPEEEKLELLKASPGKILYLKGAPERVVNICSRIMKGGGIEPLTDHERHQLAYVNQELAARGLRVLGLAYRELPDKHSDFTEKGLERDLTFLGFVGMMDTPRRDAVKALKECQKAGVKVVMITGDHKLTAMAVAAEMNILRKGQRAMTGDELAKTPERDFIKQVENTRVYARVSPEDKLRILNAWKKKGHTVVMTGDGVNDAPALKRSDLGVAMGITGTDVAKESADMVLTDDNFASIVGAVEEGRSIYQNVRKFVRYLLSTNAGEVATIFVAALILLPLPLVPLQILWINLITDGLPAIALGVEPKERGLMRQKPRSRHEAILSGGISFQIIWVGMLMMVGTLLLFWSTLGPESMWDANLTTARTVAFYTLTMFQMFNVLAIRVEGESVFTAGFFKNRYLIVAVLSTIVLQLVVIYVPMLQGIFETTALGLQEIVICTAVASSVFFLVELEKLMNRRRVARRTEG